MLARIRSTPVRVVVEVHISKIAGFRLKDRGGVIGFVLRKGRRCVSSASFPITELGDTSVVMLSHGGMGDSVVLSLPLTLYEGSDGSILDKSCYLDVRRGPPNTPRAHEGHRWSALGSIEIPLAAIACNSRKLNSGDSSTIVSPYQVLGAPAGPGLATGIFCDMKVAISTAATMSAGAMLYDDDSPPLSNGTTDADPGGSDDGAMTALKSQLAECQESLRQTMADRGDLHAALERQTKLAERRAEKLQHSRERVSELKELLAAMEAVHAMPASASAPTRPSSQNAPLPSSLPSSPKEGQPDAIADATASDGDELQRAVVDHGGVAVALAVLRIENSRLRHQLRDALNAYGSGRHSRVSSPKGPALANSPPSDKKGGGGAAAAGDDDAGAGDGDDYGDGDPVNIQPLRNSTKLGSRSYASVLRQDGDYRAEDSGDEYYITEDSATHSSSPAISESPRDHISDERKHDDANYAKDAQGFERRYSALFPSPSPAVLAYKLERTTYSSSTEPDVAAVAPQPKQKQSSTAGAVDNPKSASLVSASTQTSVSHEPRLPVSPASDKEAIADDRGGYITTVCDDLERARIEVDSLQRELERLLSSIKQQKDQADIEELEWQEKEQEKLLVLEERLREQQQEMRTRREMVDEERAKVHALKAVLMNHTEAFSPEDSERLYLAGVILTGNSIHALNS